MIDTDVLEHADRHDPVEPAGNVAIVLQEEGWCVGAGVLVRARLGDLELFVRQGHAGDIGASGLGQIQRKSAPAGPDVEHALAALDQQLGGEMPLLGKLGVIQRRVGAFEIGAAILPVGIEKQRIEPAVEIVMALDVAPGTAARIELLNVADDVAQQPLRLGPARRHFGLVEDNRQDVRDGAFLHHQRSVRIDFAERQFGIEQEVSLGGRSGEAYRDGLSRAVAESKPPPIGQGHFQGAPPDELAETELEQTIHRAYLAIEHPQAGVALTPGIARYY